MKNYNGDFDSVTNQKIKERFINREVFMSGNTIISELMECSSDFNMLVMEACTISDEDLIEVYHDCYEGNTVLTGSAKDKREQIIAYMQDFGLNMREILEYWFVSPWLAEKLKDKGEVIIEGYDAPIWGRTTSGQHMLLDSVISHICADLEILEGQANEWKVI